MLVAATYENGQVFQHFGDTPEFMTYTIEGGKVTAKAPLSTGGANHVGLIPVLADAGVSEEKTEAFRQGFDATFGAGAVLPAVNLVAPRQFRVDLPSVSIKVDPRQADLLETRTIDGRNYLLIPIEGDISVNGQPVFAPIKG